MNSAYSDIKLFHHMDRLNKIKKGEICSPVYIRLKPTNRCNQKCYYCFYANGNNINVYKDREVNHLQEIPWEKMEELLFDFYDMGVKAVTFTGGGDPLVYSHILDAVNLVKKFGIDFALITNGQELTEDRAVAFSKAKWVRISVDSPSGEVYKKIRGVNTFESVIDNIASFAKIKEKSCTLGINCVVNEYNFRDVYKICELMKGIGVNNIKFSPVNVGLEIVEKNRSMKETVDADIKRAISDFQDEEFQIINKYSEDITAREDYDKPYKKCFIRYLFTVIAADMHVYNCIDKAYIKNGELGDISHQSFKRMWYSKETQRKLENYDIEKNCNFRCICEDRNKILYDFLTLDEGHINFI